MKYLHALGIYLICLILGAFTYLIKVIPLTSSLFTPIGLQFTLYYSVIYFLACYILLLTLSYFKKYMDKKENEEENNKKNNSEENN